MSEFCDKISENRSKTQLQIYIKGINYKIILAFFSETYSGIHSNVKKKKRQTPLSLTLIILYLIWKYISKISNECLQIKRDTPYFSLKTCSGYSLEAPQ